MELEATWMRAVKVWWSFFWRKTIALIVGITLGTIIVILIGLVLRVSGASDEIIHLTIRSIGMPIGVIIGFLASIVCIKMILGKDFGEFRLILLQSSKTE
ncbi:MAG: hypothetical protein CSB24_00275 [Deltaproteobacteria bacterium]|nr:MAG: hypothetical protein CSB24_00275 [Deltaproteobacteria bacterium]